MKQLEIIVESQVNVLAQPRRCIEEISVQEALREAQELANARGIPCRLLWADGRKSVFNPQKKRK